MSWLNSFNALKGQLTNLAQEVLQEVQASNEPEEEVQQESISIQHHQPPFELNTQQFTEQSQKSICEAKDNEASDKNDFTEDSWCWEPVEVSSTQTIDSTVETSVPVSRTLSAVAAANVTNDSNSETSSSGEIVNIPLDSPHSKGHNISQKLSKLQEENRLLNEKIIKLTSENDELNRNLDELDSQHNLAIENVLQSKRDIQKKLTLLTKEYENQRKKIHDGEEKLQNIEKEFNDFKLKYEELQESNTENIDENIKLKLKLEQYDKQKIHEKIEKVDAENALKKNHEKEDENELLKKKVQSLTEKLEELENEKKHWEKIESSASSTSGKQSLDGGFIVVDDDNHNHMSWEHKYNELLSEKSKHEAEITDLSNTIKDWQAKYALLQAENSNFMAKIDELKSAKTVDPNRFNELKHENEQLRQDLETANIEYIDYQDEQISIRKELDDKILSLEDKILDLQDRNSNLENDNQKILIKIDELTKSKLNDTENFEKLLNEKHKFEFDFEELQSINSELKSDLEQQRKQYENKIADLENEVKILTQSRRSSPEQVPTSELIDIDKLRSENEEFLLRISELTDKMSKCEANASEVEAKMMMENVNLRKRISDLEMALRQNNTSDNIKTSSDKQDNSNFNMNNSNTIKFDELQQLFSNYIESIDFDDINDVESIEKNLKLIKDRLWKVEVLEKNLKQMSDEIMKGNSERNKLQHEVTTLNADIDNYKIECEELLKNNRILLDEIENYQSSKLPAISEHNEESLVQLEKQLEEIKELNRKLDDELKQLTHKFEETELERDELQCKLISQQDINTNLKTQIDNLNKQLDAMEAEKCNLIFEINEMKTDDKKSAAVDAELFEHKAKISNLEQQLDHLTKEHSDLLAIFQPQQNNYIDSIKNVERLETLLRERDLLIIEKDKEITKFKNEFEILQLKLIEDSSTEDDKQKLVSELENLKNENDALKEKLEDALKNNINYLQQIENFETKIDNLTQINSSLIDKNMEHSEDSEHEINELRKTVEALNIEKMDIIKTLQMKHAENLQYYNEIQRLNKILEEMNEKLQNQKKPENCSNCEKIQMNLNEVNLLYEKLEEQVNFLKEKSDILTTNLLTEQTNHKLLQQENKDLTEQKVNLIKDLERLQQHLVTLEESHTQEILEMQLNMNKMRQEMTAMENEIAKSSTAFTSASIRANQQAETLQTQYLLVTQQRDELATKISLAEDRESKNQAAIVNLQCALEQFQNEKQKDIEVATARLRKEIKYEKDVQTALKTEINSLKDQLADANQGLLAASRISDQLESSKEIIVNLKAEIANLQEESRKLKEKVDQTESSQADKIEKSLIKSLIIGYIVSSNNNDKSQILKVITSVLDFNQAETDKVGAHKQSSGWFGGLLGTAASNNENKDSLVEAFVNFLERESQPRNNQQALPNLLNIVSESSRDNQISQSSMLTTTTTPMNVRGSTTSTSGVHPILINDNVMSEFAPTRNSSSILKDILSDS